MFRRLVLTSFILFLDIEEGYTKLGRLIVGTFISVLFLALTMVVRPYKHVLDDALATCAHLLLVCSFVGGIGIKLCSQPGQVNSGQCDSIVGLGSADQVAVIVVGASFIMLTALLGALGQQIYAVSNRPALLLRATQDYPELTLPKDKSFHLFASHTWATGQATPNPTHCQLAASLTHFAFCQDQTHTVVRQLQLLLPEIKIWLV